MLKYPNIKVKLVGLDGNAFFIIGRFVMAMKKADYLNQNRMSFTNRLHLVITMIY